ncbi:MAG: glycoside hydrolase family 2 [Acidobacteria bacterium]|nr:glycoside hydrolase family 2 [Acidobacteriota bacterium]
MIETVEVDTMRRALALLSFLLLGAVSMPATGSEIPLPEHPRPGFERAEWVNLNGPWSFRFDGEDAGEAEGWGTGAPADFPLTIQVPFPWGAPLSGVADEADIGWYARTVRVPMTWAGRRVFLCVGASDWRTTAWLDGELLGTHQGGYTPFDLELTEHMRPGEDQTLVVRVDDSPHSFKLEGKQGYGPARGLWQTVYLEARPAAFIDSFELRPDLSGEKVEVRVRLGEPAGAGTSAALELGAGAAASAHEGVVVPKGEETVRFEVSVPRPHLWSLEDPHLYHAAVLLRTSAGEDRVQTYFGMREISTVRLPGLGHPYVALNGKPVYLQMTLDQGWHPEGFTTWPSDAVMRDEVLLARRLGLNAIRTHVKVELPRKLYWADRLGVLVMSDVPNSWGEPDEAMRDEWEHAFRGMVRRDFNHPSIFSWVLFNETWGLFTSEEGGKSRRYLPETQAWVASRVDMAKELDPTRLVEDNSVCCGIGHVKTDMNTWHQYLPGWKWREKLGEAEEQTFPGSGWNYEEGRTQGDAPMFNSECGNVWGYEGSTGDVDWSFDYHAMLNEFRRHPKVAGWLYTEHHDVINEWNGYVRADRSAKETGFSDLAPGMSLRDLHGPFYVVAGSYPTASVDPGDVIPVPLWASFLTDVSPGPDLTLRMELVGHDDLGRFHQWWEGERAVPFAPWTSRELEPMAVPMPDARAVAVLRLSLLDPAGRVLHRNFTAFVVGEGPSSRDEARTGVDGRPLRILRAAPSSFSDATWSVRQWDAMDGLKVNGAGSGVFEYRIPWPADLRPEAVASATFLAELGAKELFGKDRPDAEGVQGDYMRGRGAHDPGLNPNAYPMTDTVTHPSAVRVRVGGAALGTFDLADDPADHRGLLSWHSQSRDGRLREAGSYGELVAVTIPAEVLAAAAPAGEIVVRLEVDATIPGGLAVYGERFGRYPLDPTVVLTLER